MIIRYYNIFMNKETRIAKKVIKRRKKSVGKLKHYKEDLKHKLKK